MAGFLPITLPLPRKRDRATAFTPARHVQEQHPHSVVYQASTDGSAFTHGNRGNQPQVSSTSDRRGRRGRLRARRATRCRGRRFLTGQLTWQRAWRRRQEGLRRMLGIARRRQRVAGGPGLATAQQRQAPCGNQSKQRSIMIIHMFILYSKSSPPRPLENSTPGCAELSQEAGVRLLQPAAGLRILHPAEPLGRAPGAPPVGHRVRRRPQLSPPVRPAQPAAGTVATAGRIAADAADSAPRAASYPMSRSGSRSALRRRNLRRAGRPSTDHDSSSVHSPHPVPSMPRPIRMRDQLRLLAVQLLDRRELRRELHLRRRFRWRFGRLLVLIRPTAGAQGERDTQAPANESKLFRSAHDGLPT
jgi:hypothetical protein